MVTSPLKAALESYETALSLLETADEPSPKQGLDVLIARDGVQAGWIEMPQHFSDQLILLWQLDKRLRQQAQRITQVVDLTDVRNCFSFEPTAWWWFLENVSSVTPVNMAVDRYKTALANLETEIAAPSEKSNPDLLIPPILDVFLARDALQTQLSLASCTETLVTVSDLDKQLRQQFDNVLPKVQRGNRRTISERLEDLRDLSKPSEAAWWWFQRVPIYPGDRLDLGWNALTLIWLAATFSLLMDISTRFLSGGPGTFGAFAVIFQSILALAGGGALTKTGQTIVERSLKSLRIPRWFWQEAKFAAASLLLLFFVGFRLALPRIAVEYNNVGYEDYQAGRLDSAEAKYKRALALHPDYPEAHYNLGLLYEDLQNYDSARTEYNLAVRGNFPLAHNNLARLHILAGKYVDAVNILSKGITLLENNEEITAGKEAVQYTLYKNLGWSRFKQGRYKEAKDILEAAIAQPGTQSKASAHCLLAQTLEKLKEQKKVLEQWKRCADSKPNKDLPEEDGWVHTAEERQTAEERRTVEERLRKAKQKS